VPANPIGLKFIAAILAQDYSAAIQLLRRAFRTLPYGKGGLLFYLSPFSFFSFRVARDDLSRPGKVVVNMGK